MNGEDTLKTARNPEEPVDLLSEIKQVENWARAVIRAHPVEEFPAALHILYPDARRTLRIGSMPQTGHIANAFLCLGQTVAKFDLDDPLIVVLSAQDWTITDPGRETLLIVGMDAAGGAAVLSMPIQRGAGTGISLSGSFGPSSTPFQTSPIQAFFNGYNLVMASSKPVKIQ